MCYMGSVSQVDKDLLAASLAKSSATTTTHSPQQPLPRAPQNSYSSSDPSNPYNSQSPQITSKRGYSNSASLPHKKGVIVETITPETSLNQYYLATLKVLYLRSAENDFVAIPLLAAEAEAPRVIEIAPAGRTTSGVASKSKRIDIW